MWIEIEPLDTLFFRDSGPFDMGEENWVNGYLLPPPSVLYGALRSKYFADHSSQIALAGEANDPTVNLRIKNIFYYLGQDGPHLPLPLDLVPSLYDYDHERYSDTEIKERFKQEMNRQKREKSYRVKRLSMEQNRNLIYGSSSCLEYPPLLLISNDMVNKLDNGMIDLPGFREYLHNLPGKEEWKIRSLKDYIINEPKIGIAKDKLSGASQEGMLYRVDMKRYQSPSSQRAVRIILNLEGLQLPDKGILKLGGEGKAAKYNSITNASINRLQITPNQENSDLRRFKLYLSTPAVFQHGWLPAWVDPETLIGTYSYHDTHQDSKEIKLHLVTAVIGKHHVIGGFDIKKRRPKGTRRMVPAGSVYYFELLDDCVNTADVLEAFQGKSISEDVPDCIQERNGIFPNAAISAKQGFGITYVGVWN